MWVTVSDLAKELNLTQATIRNKIKLAEFDAFKIGNDWRIWTENNHNDRTHRFAQITNERSKAKAAYHARHKNNSAVS